MNYNLNQFKYLKEKSEKRSTTESLFSVQTATQNYTLEVGYEISLLIAKSGKNHTTGEDLIKPAISTFLRTVLEKDDKDVKGMPLSNNTVSKRKHEMTIKMWKHNVLKS
jgi:hypothetical protein